MKMEKIAEAYASARATVGDKIDAVRSGVADFRDVAVDLRDRAPTLTGALLLATFVAGGAVGGLAWSPFVRLKVNAEWRERIAAKSGAARAVISKADDDNEKLDREIISALGATDAALTEAETKLHSLSKGNGDDKCRVPADRLRQQ